MSGASWRTLIGDSYACREGKGAHAAVRRAQAFARRSRYFLKTDVLHFFETLDQGVVLRLVGRKVKDGRLLALLERILRVPVTGSAPGKGLPIGSLTSQHLANFTLGTLDRFLRETLRQRRTIRYMDDVLVFADAKPVLHETLAAMVGFARRELDLELKARATRIAPVRDGIPFLGFRVFPGLVRLARPALVRFARRLRAKERHAASEVELAREAQSLIAHIARANTRGLRKKLLAGPAGGAPTG